MRRMLALVACWLFGGCLDVAERRAERDEQIGRAERGALRVHVSDGLAVVRDLQPGRLELWANAPSLRVMLTLPAEAPREWVLRARNVLPGVQLRVREAGGRAVFAQPLESALATESTFAFTAEPGSSLQLDLASADADAPDPFDFIAFADVQDAIDRVQDVFAKMNTVSSARFAVMAGDITESGGAEECERFQREQQGLRIPIYATLGNHELGDSKVPYHDYFGRGSQSFVFHQARFTTLDSASATVDLKVYTWLDHWLEQGRGGAHFVFMHIPPLEPVGIRNGAFSSRAEAHKLLARLGRGDVTGTFYGHIHSYYRFDNVGIPAFISGGGGAIPERFDDVGRHFLVVSADPKSRGFSTRLVRVD